MTRQDIGFGILRTMSIDNLEVVPSQILSPTGLAAGQNLCCIEVLQVLVVCKHHHLSFHGLQQALPFPERGYYCPHFLVMGIILDPCWRILLTIESNRM